MSQRSVTSYFTSRKRVAPDDLCQIKRKQIYLDQSHDTNNVNLQASGEKHGKSKTAPSQVILDTKTSTTTNRRRSGLKRSDQQSIKGNQPKIVRFTLAGSLSPKRNIRNKSLEESFGKLENVVKKNLGMHTPTKEEQMAEAAQKEAKKVIENMPMEQVKDKVIRSKRLQDLKESLSKLRAMEEDRKKRASLNGCALSNFDRGQVLPNSDDKNAKECSNVGKNLKQFETIEVEVLSSPQKGLRTPTKSPFSLDALDNNELMSPKKTPTQKRLFSPTKSSPVKSLPAYQKFQSLIESGRPTLQLPYKYRCLAEIFKCLDTVCAMFFNRREIITMKKLKPAVQRLLRKNFTETSLAQINYLYPDAYKFQQKKMLNAGSHTKYDYFQLVITPNIKEISESDKKKANSDDISQQTLMNPEVIIARQQHFQKLLLNMVHDGHEEFLKTLNPPMNINRDKVTRWHPEFDLESCSDIGQSALPQPPNVEKFSSAKDILATARNLFDCSTPSERIMRRYEAKQKSEKVIENANVKIDEPFTATVLKGVPKALLERIRARQAAKNLDSMTRRPSQEKEINNYARLPDLARHVRNIFVTESKSVLDLDSILTKLENSYREQISRGEMKQLLQLLSKETPINWLTFHHIRKTDFVKVNKNEDLTAIVNELEKKAQEKQ